jgi:predicted metal-dependent peptidase
MLISPVKIEGRGPFAKAKVQLVLNHQFFGVLACHLPTVPVSPAVFAAVGAPPTAMVDGKKIYYNPKWVETLTDRQRLGLLAHEVLHPALQHLWRRGNRKHHLWLMATDYAVNDIIMRTMDSKGHPAFELPPGGLYDTKFTGMAAEQIYAVLLKEEQEQEEEAKKNGNQGQPKPGQGRGQALDGQLERPLEGGDAKPKKGKKGKPQPKKDKAEGGEGAGKDKPEAEQDKKDNGGKDGEKAPQQDSEDEPGLRDEIGEVPPGDLEDKPEDGKDGEGAGEDGDESEDTEGEGDDGETDAEGEGDGEGDAGDAGDSDNGGDAEAPEDQTHGEGGKFDHACGDIEEADAELEEHWRGVLNQAAMVAKARGNLPAALARLVEDVSAPKVPWQQVIEQYVNEVVRDDYDMMKQDRRFMQSGIYFPELQSNATSVAIFVDTSGSIGEKEIKAFVSEIVGILRCRGIKSARIIACDDKIHEGGDNTITPTDTLPENYPGGGGTDFRPPFKRLRDDPQGETPALIVYLTDMMGTFPDKDPLGTPTIWLASCPPWMKEADIPQPPFGTVIPYDPLTDDDDE